MGVLRFRLFGFPIDIQPSFWLASGCFGLLFLRSIPGTLTWVAVVFVSVLVHELGHALLARRFGQKPFIVLYMFGGITTWQSAKALGRWRHIAVSLAGPFAGFALGIASLLVFALTTNGISVSDVQSGVEAPALPMALALMMVVNFFYGALNLLPVLPFDGGQVLAAALGPERRLLAARLSLIFGLVIAVVAARIGWYIAAALFGVSAITSYLNARRGASRVPASPELLTQVLTRAKQALDAGEYEQAALMARAVIEAGATSETRMKALQIGGWAALLSGDLAEARAAMREAPPDKPLDVLFRAAIHEADGDAAQAIALLAEARAAGDERPEVVGAWVRTLVAASRYDEAAALTGQHLTILEHGDVRKLAQQGLAEGFPAAAAPLFVRLYEVSGKVEDALEAARAYVRAGQLEAARALVEKAIAAGTVDLARLREDSDLVQVARVELVN
jgi:Zn-dependent protease